MKIKASELPLQSGGQIYHLHLHPEELADTIILVGDPGRVPSVSEKFDSITVKRQNRELVTHTGTVNRKRISVVSTGMGTDNIDIVVNELDALANVDLKTMEIKKEHKSLNLIRIGSCGILQADIPVNALIASEYGLGLDGVIQFYQHDGISDETLVEKFIEFTHWHPSLPNPYCVAANTELVSRIGYDMYKGITATASGFFGPQGRNVRAQIRFPELNKKIEQFEFSGKKINNLEMECSALFGLSKILGHKALACCVGIANRVTGEFSNNYHSAMDKLIETVLERIEPILEI
jgi:uridine phosphorylase